MSPKRSITSDDIAKLRELLQNTDTIIVTPDDGEHYAKSNHRWSGAAEKPAGACLVPRCAKGVSIAVKYASEHNLDIAVKGGGHSTAGTSSTDGGLAIDLQTGLRYTEVDPEAKTIKVGGGSLWGDVDSALHPHGLAAVGGTVSDTGVGGLTLGGGFGWLSNKHGLVIDNLLECTVVLANGQIVKSSEKENSDLFWALRGAGQNFGVVIEFVLQAHPQGNMWAGVLLFPPTPEIITKSVDILNDIFSFGPDGKTKAAGCASGGIGFTRVPPELTQTAAFIVIAYNGPEDDGKALFQDLLDLQPIASTMATVSYEVANKMMPTISGHRCSLKGSAFELPIRPDFVMSVFEAYEKFITDAPDARESQVIWELLDSTKTLEVSNSAMAFANRGRHFNVAVAPIWRDAKNDEVCRQWARDVARMFKGELESRGAETGPAEDGWIGKRGEHGATMVYGNYDQYEEGAKDLFGANYERLRQLKAKYDPGKVFNKMFVIEPAT